MARLLDFLRRRRATVLFEAALALVAVAVVLLAPGEAHGTAEVELSRAAGTLSLANSRAGAAIFQADNMRPGQQASGSVRVTNTGTLGAALRLAPALSDPSGLLAARLRLVVSDVTDADRPATLYAGPLSAMGTVAVGALAAGQGRDFLFVASLPAGTPASDNPLQGSALAASFTWTATAAAPAEPTATPQPPSPTPTPAPTVVPTPAPTPTPPPATCAPRKVKIKIRAHGRRILKVTVKVGHKRARKVKPRAKFKVTVKGAAPAKVKVTATLSGGKRLVIRKRVPGCAA
jgi:hypothetical protein